jgi:ribosome maturation factor RimP
MIGPQLNNQLNRGMSMTLLEEIAVAITPAIEAAGCYLEEVTLTPAGKRKIMTVIVDGDTNLSLDQVTAVSKEVSAIVEVLPALGDTPFTLEVTSPGVDRPLTHPRHWRKNHGRLITVTLEDGKVVKGRIGDSTEIDVEIDSLKIAYAAMKRALIEIEFKSLKPSDSEGDE